MTNAPIPPRRKTEELPPSSNPTLWELGQPLNERLVTTPIPLGDYHSLDSPQKSPSTESMARLSGLQREVLSLYRQCLREVRKKPIDSQPNFKNYARAEFQKHLSVNKKDFSAIEYLLRKGHRQLEMYASPGIRNIR